MAAPLKKRFHQKRKRSKNATLLETGDCSYLKNPFLTTSWREPDSVFSLLVVAIINCKIPCRFYAASIPNVHQIKRLKFAGSDFLVGAIFKNVNSNELIRFQKTRFSLNLNLTWPIFDVFEIFFNVYSKISA